MAVSLHFYRVYVSWCTHLFARCRNVHKHIVYCAVDHNYLLFINSYMLWSWAIYI